MSTFEQRSWHGRTALITGASSGIGRATAEALAALGMKVAICARRRDRLQALAETLQTQADDVLVVPADLRDPSVIGRMFHTIRGRFGGIDVLINNAGLGRKAPLLEGPAEAWQEMLQVNVLALCECTREAITDMRNRGDDGHVIHIASMAAHRVPTGSGVYSASKFAVRSLTEGLRLELRAAESNIRVSAISPGFVETEFAQVYHGTPDAAEKTYGRYPVLQPEDIAEAVKFVLTAPPHMQVHDLLVRPTRQAS